MGYDADVTLVDLKARRTIIREWIASRCGWTPFDGREVKGWPKATILRGQFVMREDELLGEPIGAAGALRRMLAQLKLRKENRHERLHRRLGPYALRQA